VRFVYQKDAQTSKPVEVAPYRLINHDGAGALPPARAGHPDCQENQGAPGRQPQ
jgi:hypothetical protein